MCLYGVWVSVCRAASRSRGGRYSGRTPVFGCALADPRSVAQNFWRLQNETVHSLRYRLLISTSLNNCIGESTFLDACSQTGLLYESTGAFRAPGRRWMVVVAQSRAEQSQTYRIYKEMRKTDSSLERERRSVLCVISRIWGTVLLGGEAENNEFSNRARSGSYAGYYLTNWFDSS